MDEVDAWRARIGREGAAERSVRLDRGFRRDVMVDAGGKGEVNVDSIPTFSRQDRCSNEVQAEANPSSMHEHPATVRR